MTRTHLSLFSGAGMLDRAVEQAGFATVAQVEIDPWLRNLLSVRFPHAQQYDDVRTYSPAFRPTLVSGGFPCQDLSLASTTKTGLSGARSGLWDHMARIIDEAEPQYVLIENVASLERDGLVKVRADLLSSGYHVRWQIRSAAAEGAPHERKRLFVFGSRTRRLDLPVRASDYVAKRTGSEIPTPTVADGRGGPGRQGARAG